MGQTPKSHRTPNKRQQRDQQTLARGMASRLCVRRLHWLLLCVPVASNVHASPKTSIRRNGTEGVQFYDQRLSPRRQRLLYILTAVNPSLAVLTNNYKTRVHLPVIGIQAQDRMIPPAATVYRTLFYFARLKPRLLFSIGAALRALQLSTALRFVFDPSTGVGAGLNLISLCAASRWPS